MAPTDRRDARVDRPPPDADDGRRPDDANAGPVGDLIRRFAAVGLSGFFTTESALRKAFGDAVPKDWLDFVSDQSDRGRQELFDRVAAEIGRVLDGLDLEALIEDLVTDRTIEIEARVKIGRREADARGAEAASEGTGADEPASGPGPVASFRVKTRAADPPPGTRPRTSGRPPQPGGGSAHERASEPGAATKPGRTPETKPGPKSETKPGSSPGPSSGKGAPGS